jgi:hypothetical protein
MTVYGLFISPIGWELALLVWAYAFAAFIITDFLKVLLYKLFEHEDIRFKSRVLPHPQKAYRPGTGFLKPFTGSNE